MAGVRFPLDDVDENRRTLEKVHLYAGYDDGVRSFSEDLDGVDGDGRHGQPRMVTRYWLDDGAAANVTTTLFVVEAVMLDA